MSQDQDRIVHIWDDPESRINFLETVLEGKSWEAMVYHPPIAPNDVPIGVHPLQDLVEPMAKKGYKTELGRDENGLATLSIKNFGNDTKLLDAVKGMGLAKGVGYKLRHINEPLGNALSKTKDLLTHVATDKARAIGGLYMLGDVLLIGAGFGNKDASPDNPGHHGNALSSKLNDPANLLQSTAGVAATLQSLIYMAYAKEGGEAVYSQLMDKAEQATKEGRNMFDDSFWDDAKKRDGIGIINKIFKDHPIQTGALTQVLGQVSLLGSGAIRYSRAAATGDADMKQGGFKDMLTAVNSIAGWSLLMHKPKEIADEDKLPWSNPKRVWQEMQESPNQFASGFLGAASVAGVGAALNKKNNAQLMANVTYLAGDGVMFATKSDDYGAQGMSDSEMLAEAAEKFVTSSPMVLGKAEQEKFVGQLSRYVAERTLNDQARKEKKDVSEADVEELSARVADGLQAKLPAVHPKTHEVAVKAATIVSKFHPAFANQISGAICEAVCEAPSVMIDPKELQENILKQVDMGVTLDSITMKDVAKPMSDLAFAIPGGATPERVNRLYDAIDDLVRPEPTQGLRDEQVTQAMHETATQDVQAAVQQAAQEAGAGQHAAALQASRAMAHSHAQAPTTQAR